MRETTSRISAWVRELNWFYRSQPALYEVDFAHTGFEWIDLHDVENSIIVFVRWSAERRDLLVFVCNFTPMPRQRYRIGVPRKGYYQEVFNTDAEMFGGSNMGNGSTWIASQDVFFHNQQQSMPVTVPPLAVVAFRFAGPLPEPTARMSAESPMEA